MKQNKSRSEEKVIVDREHMNETACECTQPYHAAPSTCRTIRLGVCAMSKKIRAKPMQEILKRLECRFLNIIIIDDEYWQRPLKLWPVVDALICFYSEGFPYTKAWRYVEDTKPFLINNLDKQQILWDRTLVYQELKKYNIPTAKHYFVRRRIETRQQLYMKHNSSIDADANERKELLRISEKEEFTEEGDEPCKMTRNGSEHSSEMRNKKSSTEERRTNNLLEISPSKTSAENQKRNKSSKKRKTSNSLSRHPMNILNELYANLQYEEFEITEHDDHIMIGSNKLKKPFVEKPFDAENHEVCIYYPEGDGGGRKMLFRKKTNSCSSYQPTINNIRQDDNYIYEEYLATNGFDIKVYTVGPYYMHAEARKSPSLDGVVQRNQNGKEKRYPVLLTPEQKFIAQKIVKVFGQQICGFDILRSGGKSYVCDVNGWSFVKSNHLNYYDDCATLLKKMVFEKLLPDRVMQIGAKNLTYGNFMNYTPNPFKPPSEQIQQSPEELRSIVAIFRHGDRSPKQKMKLYTTDPRYLCFVKGDCKEVKIKDPNGLTKLLETTNEVLKEMTHDHEHYLKILQLKSVLEIGGHFQGLNRKVQLKVVEKEPASEESSPSPNKYVIKKIALVLKWGGELTHNGEEDAVELGKSFRLTKYPQDEGLISMHSSYRHDLKTYSSDESRCLKTAASFLKGYLDLEGDLTPIINSLVQRDKKAQKLLDCSDTQNPTVITGKQRELLEEMLNTDDLLENSFTKHFSLSSVSSKMVEVIRKIGNPLQRLHELLAATTELTNAFSRVINQAVDSYYINAQDVNSQSDLEPQSESLVLMFKRWVKLQKDLYDTKKHTKGFVQSKIPDIYDSILYDVKNNRKVLEKIYPQYNRLLELAQMLAYFVVPNEYGVEKHTRLKTAELIVTPLCKKILVDLMFWKDNKFQEEEQYWKYRLDQENQQDKQWRHVRTRLYFTSSSHIYSLYNMLAYGNNGELLDSCEKQAREQVRRLIYIGYLSNIELKLYENLAAVPENPKRFRLELMFCPSFEGKNPSQKLVLGHSGFTIEEIETFFKTVLGNEWSKQPKK